MKDGPDEQCHRLGAIKNTPGQQEQDINTINR